MPRSFISSAVSQKCPRCRKGELFYSGTYDLKNFTKMRDECPVCGQQYMLEPSFYDGAMYVSYALQVALFVSVFVAIQVLYPDAEVGWYIGGIIGLVVLLYPLIFRLARSFWIHFFVSYKGEG